MHSPSTLSEWTTYREQTIEQWWSRSLNRGAAQREIHEEAGFDQLTWLADLDVKSRLNGAKTKWVTQHYFLFYTEQIESKPTDPRHAPSVWFAIDELPSLCWPEQLEMIVSNRKKIEELVKQHAQSH